MKRLIKKVVSAVMILGMCVALSATAQAGKGGFGGGMSRGGMGGGGMSRGGMGGGMSFRNFGSPARSMSSNFSPRGGMSSHSRNVGNHASRNMGGSPFNGMNSVRNVSKGTMGRNGNFSDIVKSRGSNSPFGGKGKFDDVVKGRVGSGRGLDVIRDRIGGSSSPFSKGTGLADAIRTGKIHSGAARHIDRSKLRDLVRGIDNGKSSRSNSGIGNLAGVDMLSRKGFGLQNGFGPGGCFPSKKDHGHNGHWLDFCFGSSWYGPSYGDYCHDYYSDPCWSPVYPVYSYPTCGVTFGTPAPVEVVTVAATEPVMLDSIINLEPPKDEATTTDAAVDSPNLEDSIEAETKLDEAIADSTSEEPTFDEPKTEVASAKPVVQSELDLELSNVEMVDAGDRDANRAPRFKVTVRNAGKRDVEKFIVSLVACKDAELDSSSLHASTTVEKLTAGEETTVEVTLPLDSLSLNRDDLGRSTPFKSLVAAVDSDERIHEGNEENNLTLIDRTSIKLASF